MLFVVLLTVPIKGVVYEFDFSGSVNFVEPAPSKWHVKYSVQSRNVGYLPDPMS